MMPIDPTTLHGRTLGSLTLEEMDACPENTTIGNSGGPFLAKTKWGWAELTEVRTSDEVLDSVGPGCVLGVPTPSAIPAPNAIITGEKPLVYAIGRFVVAPLASGDRLAFAGASVAGVSTATNYIAVYLRDAHGSEVSYVLGDGVTMDALLHAIAKAEGR